MIAPPTMRVTFVSLVLALVLMWGLGACASGTEGRTVSFAMAIETAWDPGESAASFTNDLGWEITLEEAHVALGPVYVYSATSSMSVAALGRTLSDLIVPVAHAHGGSDAFAKRPVSAELLDRLDVDALQAVPRALGRLEGRAGPVDAITVLLEPPMGVLAEPSGALHGHNVWVRGTARKDGRIVSFGGGIDIPAEGITPYVEGISTGGAELDDGGTLTITLHPARWFSDAHFERLDESTAGSRTAITRATQVYAAIYLGVRDRDSFSAHWTSASTEGM